MASFIDLSPRCPFPVPSSLHPSSGLGALLPGSRVFLCFVLHHCFTGEHPAVIQRNCIWEVNCLGPCISEKAFALLLYLVNSLTGCGNTEWLLSESQRCCLRVFESCSGEVCSPYTVCGLSPPPWPPTGSFRISSLFLFIWGCRMVRPEVGLCKPTMLCIQWALTVWTFVFFSSGRFFVLFL